MTRIKSLSQGVTQIANPYESPIPTKTSTQHRVHRSMKNRVPNAKFKRDRQRDYKKRLEDIKLKELENEKRKILNS
jgi:hypothetical protein